MLLLISKYKNLTWKRSRRPVILNEYVSIQFRNKDLLPMTCYNIDGNEEFEDEDNMDTVIVGARDHSCGSNITFSDKDW